MPFHANVVKVTLPNQTEGLPRLEVASQVPAAARGDAGAITQAPGILSYMEVIYSSFTIFFFFKEKSPARQGHDSAAKRLIGYSIDVLCEPCQSRSYWRGCVINAVYNLLGEIQWFRCLGEISSRRKRIIPECDLLGKVTSSQRPWRASSSTAAIPNWVFFFEMKSFFYLSSVVYEGWRWTVDNFGRWRRVEGSRPICHQRPAMGVLFP